MLRSRLLILVSQKQFSNNVAIKNCTRTSLSSVFQRTLAVNYHSNFTSDGIKTEKQNESPSKINIHKEPNLSEKEFLVKLKTDPDSFGTPLEQEVVDEGDVQEEKYFTEQPSPSQKLRTKQYADIIKDLIKQRKIKEAIDVMEVRMIKEDRVKPENYIYNLLLGACGRVGYTKKAFMLYNDMKKRRLNVTGGTYTALFNACANSPWPTTDGLTRATRLREIMIEKGYEPNDTNYNAMIKAFGRCGDLPTAFALVDEMLVKGIPVKDDTINFLLQSCISDKETGFRHALLVWRKLVDKNIKPSLYTFNLFLRSIRDCGLGDHEVAQDVINKLVSIEGQAMFERPNVKLLSSTEISENTVDSSDKVAEEDDLNSVQIGRTDAHSKSIETLLCRPNLMAKVPHLGSIISLSEITKPEERLLLVGSCKGFLDTMKEYDCRPDIKTFTLLLDAIPSTLAAENELMNAMKKLKVQPDIGFYNMLIKKRSMRFDYDNAKSVLNMMQKNRFLPDLVTYGVLALGCKTKDECIELVEEMRRKCYSLNAEILGAMLNQACYHVNFGYVLHVMELCGSEEIQPNKKFMETLEQFKKKCKVLSNDKKFSKLHEKLYTIFKKRYNVWKDLVQVDESEDAHPWQQFRQTSGEIKNYKWKDSDRFKARHTSLFKVKTSTKVRNV